VSIIQPSSPPRNAPSIVPADQNPCESRLGAWQLEDGRSAFKVWAPNAKQVEVNICGHNRTLTLTPEPLGYHSGVFSEIDPNAVYMYRLNRDKERADPASRFQPEGVFGPSQVIRLSDYRWTDRLWRGLELKDFILYELHVGTYTSAGTLDAIAGQLPALKALGITAIELMPLAQFSGTRNWGYDGVFPFSVQNSYGGPRSLQRLVDACHGQGLAVVLDVVYNHIGPEGNFLADFGPYFTDRYQTPWGQAINFDGPHSDEVIRFFIENALMWLEDFHIDALRLDAIHGIFDRSAQPFLALLSSAVEELANRTGRKIYLIAESDLNDSRVVAPRDHGGYGLHAQWNDDFHHALHSLQTGEQFGYYRDFGSLRDLERSLKNGYVYTGQYSKYRRRRHGNSSHSIRPSQLVVFSQNHDQIGNRMFGERSSALLTLEAQKLSAGIVLLSPYLPLLFMGEEYGEPAPFQYFTSHTDAKLAQAVREGRRSEFSAFYREGEPPDPQAESTFVSSKLYHGHRDRGQHRALWDFYRELIRLRKEEPPLRELDASILEVRVHDSSNSLEMQRSYGSDSLFVVFNFGERAVESGSVPPGDWATCLDSADKRWMGPGSKLPTAFTAAGKLSLTLHPKSFCVLKRVSSA
jgi:maltooligosyltrehalose trehalohydrolase